MIDLSNHLPTEFAVDLRKQNSKVAELMHIVPCETLNYRFRNSNARRQAQFRLACGHPIAHPEARAMFEAVWGLAKNVTHQRGRFDGAIRFVYRAGPSEAAHESRDVWFLPSRHIKAELPGRKESDIDVLVEFIPNHGWSLYDVVDMIEELQNIFGRKVDLVMKGGLRNPIRSREILKTRKIIYAA